MARMSPFSSPLLLGFDRLEEMLDRLAGSQPDAYPPYNVVHAGEERLRISLAVAGFDEDDLDVTLERNALHIRGRQDEENGAVYLYQGIAARRFHRTFLLADGDRGRRRAPRQRPAPHRADPPRSARDREDGSDQRRPRGRGPGDA